MKNLLLGLLATLFILSSTFAQMTINEYGDPTDLEGTTVYYDVTADTTSHVVDFIVNNETGGTEQWFIIREIILQPASWGNYFCWGAFGAQGECYPVSSDALFYSDTIPINDGNAGVISVYVIANDAGCGTYKYTVASESTIFGDVTIEVCSYVELDEFNTTTFNVSPNPANEAVSIELLDNQIGTLKVVDLMGKNIFQEEISGQTTVDVSDFNNGVYFVILESAGLKPVSKKIIVQH